MVYANKFFALLPESHALRAQEFYNKANIFFMTWKGGLWFALGASLFALVFVLITQFVFDYHPCVLCIWQRIPYSLCIPVAAAGLFLPQLRLWRGVLLLVCSALFLSDAGIAGFHIGVEQHWWSGTSGCAINATTAHDAASMRLALLSAPVASCGDISWTFLWLSMAAWNMLFALTCACFSAFIVLFGQPERPASYVLRYGQN
jgi:disulfide bond formation protein DsbB